MSSSLADQPFAARSACRLRSLRRMTPARRCSLSRSSC